MKFRMKIFVLAILAAIAITAISLSTTSPSEEAAVMAAGEQIFVKFSGIDGESIELNHLGWSDAESIRWSASDGNPPNYNEVRIEKELDKAGPEITKALAAGRVIPTVKIDVTTTTSSGNSVFYSYRLKGAQIVSYEINVTAGKEQTETIILDFNELLIVYSVLDNDGTVLESTEFRGTKPSS